MHASNTGDAVEEPDAPECLASGSHACWELVGVRACTCQVDLNLLAEHVQWQVLHGRHHCAPGIIHQRIETTARHQRAHLIGHPQNRESARRAGAEAHSRHMADEGATRQATSSVAASGRCGSGRRRWPCALHGQRGDLLSGCSDAVLLRNIQHERRDVAVRLSCSRCVCAPPHTGIYAPALRSKDLH